jgi:hypothetical protein
VGFVLRYAHFLGPGRGRVARDGPSPVHVDAAAFAALLAVDRAAPGSIFNIAELNEAVATDKARTELGWDPGFRLPG